jgi:hypothetical protein
MAVGAAVLPSSLMVDWWDSIGGGGWWGGRVEGRNQKCNRRSLGHGRLLPGHDKRISTPEDDGQTVILQ